MFVYLEEIVIGSLGLFVIWLLSVSIRLDKKKEVKEK